jgi:tRNA pseudouridine38-40 synthase
MARYRLIVAYEGTKFHGWQKQEPKNEPPLRTAQGVLESVVSKAVRQPVVLVGASRTDSGVHALGQVAAFSANTEIPVERLARAITSRCPEDLQVLSADIVSDDFDPIRNARIKKYRYLIQFGRVIRPLFDRRTVWTTHHHLDLGRMKDGAARLVGTHDFDPFASASHGRETTVRTILECDVAADSENRIVIEVVGNGFLYNMVRIIAGSLVEIGRGARAPESIDEAFASGDRALTGPTLGPQGLRLEWIEHEMPDIQDRTTEDVGLQE